MLIDDMFSMMINTKQPLKMFINWLYTNTENLEKADLERGLQVIINYCEKRGRY